jgi:hypothetical protein
MAPRPKRQQAGDIAASGTGPASASALGARGQAPIATPPLARKRESALQRFVGTFVFMALGAVSSTTTLYFIFGDGASTSLDFTRPEFVALGVGSDGQTEAERGFRLLPADAVRHIRLDSADEFDAVDIVRRYNEPIVFTNTPADQW